MIKLILALFLSFGFSQSSVYFSSFGSSQNVLVARDVNDATTTSATHVLLTSMTKRPPAGSWKVDFSAWMENSAIANATIGIYVGGVLETDSVRTAKIRNTLTVGSVSFPNILSTIGYVTVNGSQDVEIHWQVDAGTGTCHQRTLILTRQQ